MQGRAADLESDRQFTLGASYSLTSFGSAFSDFTQAINNRLFDGLMMIIGQRSNNFRPPDFEHQADLGSGASYW